jgi:shikimate kinase
LKGSLSNSQSIFLIGMMGSGKTTLGKRLARECKMVFLDLDREIEARNGVSVSTIFEIEGEAGFRMRETQMLADISQLDGVIVATGGGTVLSPVNRSRLLAAGCVVYLHANASLLYVRTRNDKGRPLLQVADPLARIKQLVEQRDPLYREVADIVIEAGRDTGSVANELKLVIPSLCKH